ncbi:MOSC domain-containing protein [Methylocystis sp. WRRC1]|uniref:MOSC domain-containing protein n=1 Tax=Methylocystis sp. WRRC1 TaxID=1732014 RepID=UPI001D149962|nr:MOSC domain-containing protein [Methylocystis sp. WRRC1]MCC3244609.1 MOSC domain-containing protein [Methylocystis sp. WRRC1]
MRLASIYRYPVKGLSPEALEFADLDADGYFPGDRVFALENGPSGFDPAAPEHQPKVKFLMLMRNGALAGLATRYDHASGVLTIAREGREVARGDLRSAEGRAAIETFLTGFLGDEIRGPVRLLQAPEGFRFTDSKSGFVSLVNLASVKAIEEAQGAAVDPLRFRANLYIDGAERWAEADWPGKTFQLGGATLTVLKMTDRCAATGVEPGSGRRDMDLVQTIRKAFGHIDCGVYARIERGGRVTRGDALALV